MPWQLALLLFVIIVAAVSGIARWLGASRWLAFAIPTVPLTVFLVYFLITGEVGGGHGGAMPVWIVFAFLLIIALPTSAITVFVIPNRDTRHPPDIQAGRK